MKKSCALTMAGIAIFLFASTQSFAGSGKLSFGDDMAEGVSFAEEVNSDAKSYVYDSGNAGDVESLTEVVFFSEKSETDKPLNYLGDVSIPSLQNAMSEGICLETFSQINLPN